MRGRAACIQLTLEVQTPSPTPSIENMSKWSIHDSMLGSSSKITTAVAVEPQATNSKPEAQKKLQSETYNCFANIIEVSIHKHVDGPKTTTQSKKEHSSSKWRSAIKFACGAWAGEGTTVA